MPQRLVKTMSKKPRMIVHTEKKDEKMAIGTLRRKYSLDIEENISFPLPRTLCDSMKCCEGAFRQFKIQRENGTTALWNTFQWSLLHEKGFQQCWTLTTVRFEEHPCFHQKQNCQPVNRMHKGVKVDIVSEIHKLYDHDIVYIETSGGQMYHGNTFWVCSL